MTFCSIDIESTGLDPKSHSILSIGAIIEDTKLKLPFDVIPKFNAVILQKEFMGQPRAIVMNNNLIDLIAQFHEGDSIKKQDLIKSTGYKFYEKDEIIKHFFEFLFINGYAYDLTTAKNTYYIEDGTRLPCIDSNTQPITLNVAGKNFASFDKLFLEELPWWKKLIRVKQRIIDPSILYVDWNKDKTLPTLDECKQRANIEGAVTHNALDDAWDVIQSLRKFY